MKTKTVITLVKNGDVLYPFTEEDYEELKELKCPLTNMTQDYLPLLSTYAKSKGKRVQLVPFEPIEYDMVSKKIMPRWKHGFSATQGAVVLTYPKGEDEDSIERLTQALKRWYKKHYITFDVSVRRTAKKVTVTMKKTYGKLSSE